MKSGRKLFLLRRTNEIIDYIDEMIENGEPLYDEFSSDFSIHQYSIGNLFCYRIDYSIPIWVASINWLSLPESPKVSRQVYNYLTEKFKSI